MKKLTRVKLINWHRFTNELIDFDKTVLLSGENGAGKSTLLDAIQFVITCSANNFKIFSCFYNFRSYFCLRTN